MDAPIGQIVYFAMRVRRTGAIGKFEWIETSVRAIVPANWQDNVSQFLLELACLWREQNPEYETAGVSPIQNSNRVIERRSL